MFSEMVMNMASDELVQLIREGLVEARVVTRNKKGRATENLWKTAKMWGDLPDGCLPYHPDFTVLTLWDTELNMMDAPQGVSLVVNSSLQFDLRKAT